MSIIFNSAPTYETPLTVGGKTHTTWYRYFQNIYKGLPPSSESTLTLGASPWTYNAPAKGFVIIRGGTQTQGIFPLSQGDTLTITYSVVPNIVWVPT